MIDQTTERPTPQGRDRGWGRLPHPDRCLLFTQIAAWQPWPVAGLSLSPVDLTGELSNEEDMIALPPGSTATFSMRWQIQSLTPSRAVFSKPGRPGLRRCLGEWRPHPGGVAPWRRQNGVAAGIKNQSEILKSPGHDQRSRPIAPPHNAVIAMLRQKGPGYDLRFSMIAAVAWFATAAFPTPMLRSRPSRSLVSVPKPGIGLVVAIGQCKVIKGHRRGVNLIKMWTVRKTLGFLDEALLPRASV
jgi:hypothetical protein